MRDWQGTTHEVKVLDRAVLYKRKRYRSLSEVARLITGSRWSGPLSFGLYFLTFAFLARAADP
jgi:hypothetical protein